MHLAYAAKSPSPDGTLWIGLLATAAENMATPSRNPTDPVTGPRKPESIWRLRLDVEQV